MLIGEAGEKITLYTGLYSCQILIGFQFSRYIFEQSLNIRFHENPSSGSRNGHADGHKVKCNVFLFG